MNSRSMHKEGRPDVDVVLGEFFQSEMPHPWPAVPVLKVPPTNQPRRVGSFWSGSSGRLALAASIALLVAGYVTLSGYFPRRPADSGLQDVGGVLGSKEKRGPHRPLDLDAHK